MDQILLRRQVAELLVVRASGHSFDNQRLYPQLEFSNDELQKLIKEGVGGVIFFGGSVKELQDKSMLCRKWASKPILLCADVEEGIGQRFNGGTSFLPPLGVAQIFRNNPVLGIQIAEKYGFFLGEEARKCGLNWVLAPVCDVNTNPRNPVINLRAWGEDPKTVSTLVCAFQKGISSQGVLTCAKHFPGHGDSDVDSHIELPILNHDFSRLKRIELMPFQAVIDEGVNSLMTGHLLLKQIDSKFPATLSKKVLTNLLRNEMNFDGLVVTDALVMQAISEFYGAEEAAVLAFEAGADLLMMPRDPWKTIEALVYAINSGRVTIDRLHQSLERRQRELKKDKSYYHLDSQSINDEENIYFASNEALLFSEELSKKSIIIKNSDYTIVTKNAINLLRIDSIFSDQVISKSSPALLIPEEVGFKNLVTHPLGIIPWSDDEEELIDLSRLGDKSIFLQFFVRGKPFGVYQKNDERWVAIVKELQKSNRLVGIVIYGCPYFANNLIEIVDEAIPFAYSPSQVALTQSQILYSLFKGLPKNKSGGSNFLNNFTD